MNRDDALRSAVGRSYAPAVGRLAHLGSKRVAPLPGRLLVGRAATCFLRVDQALASSEHAVVAWAEGSWSVRDLGSRNGTYVDGQRLTPSVSTPLSRGTRLAFGDPEDAWVLEDDAAPEPMALALTDREVCIGSDGLLALPDEEDPRLSIFVAGDGRWHFDDGTDQVPARDQQVVVVDGAAWCLLLPSASDATPFLDTALELDTAAFRFGVSANEEHVELTVEGADGTCELEAREHWYVLLTLARIRSEQQDRPASERGWVDRAELLKMLGMSANAFNVAIHRARRQLVAAGVVGASGVVEVRRGERRFGSDRITIARL